MSGTADISVAAKPAELPVTIYSSGSLLRNPGRLLVMIFSDLWKSRELVWILFLRDLKAQYRESYFGYLWLIAPPLATTLVWVFLNSQRIVRVETEIPYPLFVLIGTTLWSSFTAATVAPLNAFKAAKPVLMKLKVPPEAFLISGFFRSVFDLSIRLLLLVPVFLFLDFPLAATCWIFPFVVGAFLLCALCIGLLMLPVGGLYSDLSHGVVTLFGLFMYTAPVVFPKPGDGGILDQIMAWNPVTPFISLARESLVSGDLSSLPDVLLFSGIAFALCLFAFLILRVALPHLVVRMGM